MPKTKKVEVIEEPAMVGSGWIETRPQIEPLEFADVSVLKDKLNEVIKHING